MNKIALIGVVAVAALSFSHTSNATVTAEEASKLKSSLMPLGGEKAGNKDGSIPEWSGGLTNSIPGAKLGDIPTALFANEKPLLQITSKNMSQYADKLTDGAQALLKKYPDSYRVDVYKTHRTAAAPQMVYDNTFKNATRCRTKDSGTNLEGCFGGIPFPIPNDGNEVVWNFILRVFPESTEHGFKNIIISSDGSRTMATRNDYQRQYPYYAKDGSLEKWTGEFVLARFITTAPPFKAGESLVFRDNVDNKKARTAWQYLVGQRRVRRAPTVGFDTPDFVSSGANYFDEVEGFNGAIDRFEWKLVGKKEIFVPYNNNRFVGEKIDDVFSKHHLNPDKLRWELHRVWVVEASVASGKRHAVPKRKFYFDEDSWLAVAMDGYDAEGKLWRTSQGLNFALPNVPALQQMTVAVYNLQASTLAVVQLLNEEYYRSVSKKSETFFTGEALGGEGAR